MSRRSTIEPSRDRTAASRRFRSLLALVVFAAVAGVLSHRTAIKVNFSAAPDGENWKFEAFRHKVYYPEVAFLEGGSPRVGATSSPAYQFHNQFPRYSPLTLIVHLPFGLMPLAAAEVVYWMLTLVLMLVLAHLTLKCCKVEATTAGVFGVASLMLLSRPGEWNLELGQSTVLVVIGAYLALHFARERPWVAGLGLTLATVKPTFGLPLAFLLLWRRSVRAVLIGVTIAVILSAGAMAVLTHGAKDGEAFKTSSNDYATLEADLEADPVFSATRIDALAFVGRLAGKIPFVGSLAISIGILTIGALGLRRLAFAADDSTARQLSASLACVTVLACAYHQQYDLLLLALPVTALVMNSRAAPWGGRPTIRWVLLTALTLLAVNYLATERAIDRFHITGTWWLAVTSLNGGVLLVALFVYAALALARSGAFMAKPVELGTR